MENKFYEKNISGLRFEFQKWLILTFDFEDNSMTSPKDWILQIFLHSFHILEHCELIEGRNLSSRSQTKIISKILLKNLNFREIFAISTKDWNDENLVSPLTVESLQVCLTYTKYNAHFYFKGIVL